MFDVTPVQYDAMGRWYGHRPDPPGWRADFKRQRVRDVFGGACGLLAWSRWTAQSAIEDYGADPAHVAIVPPGVDTELWRPCPEARPGDGVVRILFTGGDFERKGGDLLLRWASESRRRNVELHLVTRDDIPSGDCVFVHRGIGSNAPELIALAQRCDLFALPTRADCFSIASMEAMAAGLPVITTGVGGIPDIVRDGETGLLIEPDSYPALRNAIETLVESQTMRERFGQRGREVVCEEFNVVDLVRRGLEFIRAGK
jgi:glycosyltransferase involved in cell wall biosynthesis